jgi:tetratricopeptide (TPR) repeat protein
MKQILLVVFVLINYSSVFSQTETDIQLAQHYYSNGEFDKAAGYYEKIYNATPTKVYFNRYLECLVQIKDFKTAEKTIKKQIANNKTDLELKVILGQFYDDTNEPAKAKKAYEDIVENVGNNPSVIIQTYQAFAAKGKFDYAKLNT